MNLILGLGNPILGDDSAGILAVRRVKPRDGFEIKESYYGGMRLLEDILGYDKAIIVDAIIGDEPGKVHMIGRETLAEKGHGSTVHDVSIDQAISMAEKAGMRLPEMVIIGIEISPPTEFTENVSPEVEEGIRKASEMLERIMEGNA